MSAVLAFAAPTSQPDPSQDRPAAGGGAPSGIARILNMLRWIIACGQEFASIVQQRAATPRLAAMTRRFRTTDLAVILARITRGLLLAGSLEARLAQRAGGGRDVTPSPTRTPSPRPRPTGTPARPRAAPHTNIIDLPLDRLPTAEEIATEFRRRPIGAVIVDICRDLGIMPGDMTGSQWEEFVLTIATFGGNLSVILFKGEDKWHRTHPAGNAATRAFPEPAFYAPAIAPIGTGPP